jgi:hypothetical protein
VNDFSILFVGFVVRMENLRPRLSRECVAGGWRETTIGVDED